LLDQLEILATVELANAADENIPLFLPLFCLFFIFLPFFFGVGEP